MDFTVPADYRVKTVEHENDDYRRGLIQELEDIEFKVSGDHPNYCIIKIGQNTEKSPGDLRRRAVTQTPVKGHQLTLVK